jgi:hypothetical protein
MYTLVSSSVLALDLVRHPSGAVVADTVDRVLALTGDDVRCLAAHVTDQPQRAVARSRLLDACAVEPRMSRLMLGVRRVVADGVPGAAEARTIADVLSETLLGGVADLLAMLGRELPLAERGLPAEGVQAALDAVLAAWAGRGPDGAHLADAFVLAAPWTAGAPLPPPLPDEEYGGSGRDLRDLLDAVARMTPERWVLVEQAHAASSVQSSWSTAMHEASRVATACGRLHAVARAQVCAARSLRLSGVSASLAARGGAMAVVAAVQALCVLDHLDADTVQDLVGPWEAGAA